MRILMLAQFYLPTIGGEEKHVRSVSTELVRRGHEVAVATLWHQGLDEFEIDEGVRVYRIHGTMQRAAWLFKESGRRHAPPFPDPELSLALRRVIEREKPDIVHAHNWMVHSFLPLKAWSGARLIVTLHDYSLLCAKKLLMYHNAPCSGPGLTKCLSCAREHYGFLKAGPTVMGTWAMGAAERASVEMFLPVSHAVAVGNGLVGSGLPFQVVPNFVPDEICPDGVDAEPYLAQLPGEGYLLFVGDLGVRKGLPVLLDAYARLVNAPPLVLIGRKSDETPTRFPPNVYLMNNWPNIAVIHAWKRSRIALVPSVWPEPCATVVLEAMMMGRPVIASNMGGMPDMVTHGETGLLVPAGDAVALQHAIELLLADPELGERMGVAGKQRVTQFQASTVVTQIEQVYRSVSHPTPQARVRDQWDWQIQDHARD